MFLKCGSDELYNGQDLLLGVQLIKAYTYLQPVDHDGIVRTKGPVAQWIEHQSSELSVGGSSPSGVAITDWDALKRILARPSVLQ
jgi:hypothetical protein